MASRGNKVEGKLQRSFYLSEEVVEALRTASFELRESQSEIVERAIRKELGMVARLTWEVIEDNAGGLHLAVFEGDDVIFYGLGYEVNEDGLRADLEALRNGSDPRTDGWEMPVDDPQTAYDKLTSHEHGWRVVADQDGVYHDKMGAAALRVFGEEYTGWTIRTGFHAAELPGQGDDADRIDIEQSGAKYADMIREKIETEYPGATVEINYDTNATGALPASMLTRIVDPESGEYRPGDGGEGGRIAEHVDELCGQIWESWEWVVYEEE